MSALTGRPDDAVTLAAGDVAGLYLLGIPESGADALRIVGARALATLATGLNSGTAGVGTTSTQLTKPTGASNWTADNLVGFFLSVVSGGGAAATPTLRPILSNTTTTLTVSAVAGMDSTTVFQIITPTTKLTRVSTSDLTGMHFQGAPAAIEIYGVDFSATYALDSLIQAYDCTDIKLSGCSFAINTAAPSIDIRRCAKVTIEHCRLTGSADISITDGCRNVVVSGCVNSAGGVIEVSDFVRCDVLGLTATSSPSRVLSLVRGVTAYAEAACSGGGATPIYLESISNFIATGGLLTGSDNTGYGIEIALAGLYTLTGCTITGTTGDVLFEGTHACTWALHLGNTYGRIASQTASAVAQTNPTKTIIYGNVLWDGSADHSARELYYGIINPAQNTGIVATGTTLADAYQLPAGQHYGIGTVAVNTGVKLHNVSALPGPCCVIDNEGANTLKIYPGGGGTINGAANITLAAGAIAMLVCCDFATDKWKTI